MKRDYIDFQDRSIPLAFLITFRCYGTWLHGDRRGSVNRKNKNTFGTRKIAPNPELEKMDRLFQRGSPITLDREMRALVEKAIRKVCTYRKYALHAIQARTNHVHLVVSANRKPEFLLNSFKAYSTRSLRRSSLVPNNAKVWSRHGSTKYLWTEDHVAVAVEYVVKGQGRTLPKFP